MQTSESAEEKNIKTVHEKLSQFVKLFVYFYEKSLMEYNERLETQKSKPGKSANFFNKLSEVVKPATEGIEIIGGKAGALVGVNVLQVALSSIGNKNNRNELKKLITQLYKIKHHPDQVRNALVQSGIEIFHSFECQFVQLTADGVWERAMEKLAHDAVNRILSFSRKNLDEEALTVSFLTRGVIYGESKKYINSSTGAPRIKPGHTVQTVNSRCWSTAKIFENVGVVIVKNGRSKYFHKKIEGKSRIMKWKSENPAKSLKKYGFRRGFHWETADPEFLKNFSETKTQSEYRYVLKPDDLQNLKIQLQAEINNEDFKLVEERLVHYFQEAIQQIKQNSKDNFTELEEFIARNPNDVKAVIEKHHNELLKSVQEGKQENKKDHQDIKQTIESTSERVIQTVTSYSQQRSQKTPIFFDIRETLPLFTGRTEELRKLHEMLQEEHGTNISRCVVITGLGGIGKSELVKKYVSQHFEEYDSNIIWINSGNESSLRESFCRLAKDKLKLQITDNNGNEKETKQILDDVYSYFSTQESLFVFDNAKTQKECGILPQGLKKPYTIITSRDQEWDDISSLNMSVLSDVEVKELVEKSLECVFPLEQNEAEKLAKELGNLPLALRQAVAYIKMQNRKLFKRSGSKFTVGQYLKEFKRNTAKLLSHSFNPGYTQTVMSTWKTTISKIKTEHGTTGELALRILNIMAYLAPNEIPINNLFSKLAESEEDRNSAIELLDQYSLVNFQKGSVSVHRLVQTVTRIDLEQLHENDTVIQLTYDLIEQHALYFYQLFLRFSPYAIMLHLEALLSHIDDWIKNDPEHKDDLEQKYLKNLLQWTHNLSFDPKKMKELLDRVLQIYDQKQCSTEHSETAGQFLTMSSKYRVMGDTKTAKLLLQRALQHYEQKYTSEGLEFPKILSEISTKFRILNDRKKAKQLLERALTIYTKEYHAEDLEFAKLLSEMSYEFCCLGEHKKGLTLLESSLPVYETEYGADSLEFAKTLSKISSEYSCLNDDIKAVTLLEQVLPIYQKQYGCNHLQIAKKLSEISSKYTNIGDYEKAVAFLEQALPIYEKEYGSEHLKFAEKLTEISFAYFRQNECGKAVAILERVLTIKEKYYGVGDFEVAMTLFQLGNFDSNKAHDLHDRALQLFKNLNLLHTTAGSWSFYQLQKFHSTVGVCNLEWMRRLIELGFNVLQSNRHDSVLHQAVANDNEDVFRFILNEIKEKHTEKLIVAVNAKDSKGNTPLIVAAKKGKTNNAKMLLDFGADPNLGGQFNMTALHWAAEGGHHELLGQLLQKRGDSTLKDNEARTAYDLVQKKLCQDPGNKNFKIILAFLVPDIGKENSSNCD